MATADTDKHAEPLLLSVKKVAELLGLSQWQVRQHFPIEKVGNRSYVAAKVLREYQQDAS